MWGNSPFIKATDMKSPRKIYTSKFGHDIYYNMGKKDAFQVRVIKNDQAYGLLDKDYFTIVLKYYKV